VFGKSFGYVLVSCVKSSIFFLKLFMPKKIDFNTIGSVWYGRHFLDLYVVKQMLDQI